MKKEWKVVLTDGRMEFVVSQRYRREGEQYVFENDGDTDVQFFNADFVVGIYEVPPPDHSGRVFSTPL